MSWSSGSSSQPAWHTCLFSGTLWCRSYWTTCLQCTTSTSMGMLGHPLSARKPLDLASSPWGNPIGSSSSRNEQQPGRLFKQAHNNQPRVVSAGVRCRANILRMGDATEDNTKCLNFCTRGHLSLTSLQVSRFPIRLSLQFP